ncbi:MAG TPA: hypothetical protein VE990_12490 [Acidimicrobiales bacterium]|nr:hypothetical protein [Acidimicrobiales bacterium]
MSSLTPRRSSRTPLATAVEEYLSHSTDGTRRVWGSIYAQLLRRYPRATISGISRTQLLDFVTLDNDGQVREDWSEATLRNYVSALRNLFKWAVEAGLRPDNPLESFVEEALRRIR